ncbi:MAG TPA: hypothetical protein VME66_08100, partial [Candidatus Acidoferrales bacterium]|nr:hypothetical protein [Candidatus Acidoferrales bacterium]
MKDRHQARLAVIVAVALYVLLPSKLTFGPIWIVPLLVAVLLIPLVALAPTQLRGVRLMRVLTIALVAVLNFFNVMSVVFLIYDLVNMHAKEHAAVSAIELLTYGGLIWTTNVIIFALWYWELDGDGPFDRERYPSANDYPSVDFLFPQMQIDRTRIKGAPQNWRPMFIDYLYLSFTNA